jgi:thiamine biosynthesis lipoprotein
VSRRRSGLAAAFLLSALLLAAGIVRGEDGRQVELTADPDARVIEEHATVMGTDISVLIANQDEQTARRAIDAAFEEFRRVEALMTDWRNSPFERINRQAGVAPVAVGEEILFMIGESIRISEMTGGAFDITYAGAGKLWDFKKKPPELPDAEAVRRSLDLIGYSKIRMDPKAKTVFLPNKGMRIGLGGIAKGYAVDRAVEIIGRMEIENFAVNAGGDLTVRGRKEGRLWWVAIRHPRDKARTIAFLPISNGSVVTSGDSERFFVVDGIRYSHILDPTTGYPAHKAQSVTLIAKRAYFADALATGVFVMGPVEGMAFIESQPHIEGMIVDADGDIHVSSGLQKGDSRGERTL